MAKINRLGFPIIVAYLWTVMILFGAVTLETFMVYPNIFRDPPSSLGLAMEFLSVRGPADFFRPLGFLSWVTGVGALIAGWRDKPVRLWIALSLLMIVADGLASILLLWPRNEIMFVEGPAVHSAEVLRQTAEEFQTLHWLRLAFNAASAVAIFVGFLVYDRQRILDRPAPLNARTSPGGRDQEMARV